MKKSIIISFSMAFGAAVGFGVGYIFTKKKLEGKFNDELNREIDALHKKYRSDITNIVGTENSKSIERAEKELKGVKSKEKTTDYCSFYTKKGVEIVSSHNDILDPGGPTDGDDTEANSEEEAINIDIKKAFDRGIELISEVQFNENICDGGVYDKRECIYYTEDEILTDDEDQMLDGYLDILGREWIDVLENANQNVVFVRNNKTSTDYRIEKVCDSYY